MKGVTELVCLSKSSLYDKMNPKSKRYDSSFPRPIRLGLSAVGWLEQDIIDWINSKKANQISKISLQLSHTLLTLITL
ncbi:helix-turn-helix transcriptional regulator [Acinetobacter beijerinckii]|jgi:prophage regulatory protein|uniref:helix-turn-helix transcriptional regulator n=1 Tax=Acinetobacter beijerinckii TaxID=262668 RepID=UPI00361EAE8E